MVNSSSMMMRVSSFFPSQTSCCPAIFSPLESSNLFKCVRHTHLHFCPFLPWATFPNANHEDDKGVTFTHMRWKRREEEISPGPFARISPSECLIWLLKGNTVWQSFTHVPKTISAHTCLIGLCCACVTHTQCNAFAFSLTSRNFSLL